MSVTTNSKKTWRFTEWFAIAAYGSSLLIFLTILISPFFIRTIFDNKIISVAPGQTHKLAPVEINPNDLGALRVDVNARIGSNEWTNFEIRLLDQSGKVIASGIKQAWSESGRWYEDGESGSWSESDTLGGLDVRNQKKEKVTLEVAVLGAGRIQDRVQQSINNSLNQLGDRYPGAPQTTPNPQDLEINEPISFNVTVESGIVDIGALWWGCIGSLILAIISHKIVSHSGKKVIYEKIQDSDPTGRAIMGGTKNLVKMQVKFDADEGAVNKSNYVNLYINDSYGEQIYSEAIPVTTTVHDRDGNFVKATGQVERYFVFPQQNSYGFHVEVQPDEPVDRTYLTVRDRVRTLGAVKVVEFGEST